MSEITIAQPLSGEEVIEAILVKVRKMLRDDCFLSPNSAYESFEADIAVKVKMLDIGRMPEVAIQAHVASDTPVNENGEDFALNAAEAHLSTTPPNQVRVESGQAIPTLVETAEGKKDIRPVKYANRTIVARSPNQAPRE